MSRKYSIKSSIQVLETRVLINDIRQNINQLPTTELSYYFALLLASIKNDPKPEKYIELLRKQKKLIEVVKNFYECPQDSKEKLPEVTKALEDLVQASKRYTLTQRIKRALLEIVKSTFALVLGFWGAMMGATLGLMASFNIADKIYRKVFNKPIGNYDKTFLDSLKGPGFGIIIGFAMGSLIGYRLPNTLLEKTTDIKIDVALGGMMRLGDELKNRKSLKQSQEKTKKYILDVFFKEIPKEQKEHAFEKFLKEDQQFQVCSTKAGHISKSLKGNLGHHALIRFKINGIQDIPIEFGDRKRTPGFVDQSEKPRTISGQKLFEMLTLDRILQETHKSSIKLINRYEIGSNDCLTYVNKILIGTGQNPTKMQRFSPENDTVIGSKIVAPMIGFFSRTQGNELDTLIENDKKGELDIEQHTWEPKQSN